MDERLVAVKRGRVQILHLPDCPLVEGLRVIVSRALVTAELDDEIEDLEGAYPSPTLLIDGVDVTGGPPGGDPACRLDMPTPEEVVNALLRSSRVLDGRRS